MCHHCGGGARHHLFQGSHPTWLFCPPQALAEACHVPAGHHDDLHLCQHALLQQPLPEARGCFLLSGGAFAHPHLHRDIFGDPPEKGSVPPCSGLLPGCGQWLLPRGRPRVPDGHSLHERRGIRGHLQRLCGTQRDLHQESSRCGGWRHSDANTVQQLQCLLPLPAHHCYHRPADSHCQWISPGRCVLLDIPALHRGIVLLHRLDQRPADPPHFTRHPSHQLQHQIHLADAHCCGVLSREQETAVVGVGLAGGRRGFFLRHGAHPGGVLGVHVSHAEGSGVREEGSTERVNDEEW